MRSSCRIEETTGPWQFQGNIHGIVNVQVQCAGVSYVRPWWANFYNPTKIQWTRSELILRHNAW